MEPNTPSKIQLKKYPEGIKVAYNRVHKSIHFVFFIAKESRKTKITEERASDKINLSIKSLSIATGDTD